MTRICTSCKQPGEFYKDARVKDGLMARCKVCTKVRNRAFYLGNTEKCRAANDTWKAANPEAYQAAKDAWAIRNPEKIRAKGTAYREANREKVRAFKAAWQKSNRAKSSAATRRHQAARIQRTPPWADPVEIQKVYEQAAKLGWHVDHEIPLQGKLVSGLHVQGNLRVLPPAENIRKSNRFEPC